MHVLVAIEMAEPDAGVQEALDLERDFAGGVDGAKRSHPPSPEQRRDALREATGRIGDPPRTANRLLLGQHDVNTERYPGSAQPPGVGDRRPTWSGDGTADRQPGSRERQSGIGNLGSEADVVNRYAESDVLHARKKILVRSDLATPESMRRASDTPEAGRYR